MKRGLDDGDNAGNAEGTPRWRSRRAGWSSGSMASPPSTASTCPCRKARSTAFWAPMARARRRLCACCWASSIPMKALRRRAGPRPPARSGAHHRLSARRARALSVDEGVEAIAFMGALRGLPLAEGAGAGANCWRKMAGLCRRPPDPPAVQGHGAAGAIARARWSTNPGWWCFDEPFSGLDALNQGKLERMIRAQARKGHHGDLFHPCHRPCRTAVR
jgi:hypothetical protein